MRARTLIWLGPVLLVCFCLAAQAPPTKPVCQLCGGRKVITCPHCHGKWRRVAQLAPCKRQGAAGCDETGWRKCFRCAGKGDRPCPTCRGRGRITVRRPASALFKRSRSVPCRACGGTGRQDCPHCAPGKFCSECKRCYPATSPERYCPWCYPELGSQHLAGRAAPEHALPLERAPGIIRCPRCKGRGVYEKKGPCPHCHRGQIACPACVPRGMP